MNLHARTQVFEKLPDEGDQPRLGVIHDTGIEETMYPTAGELFKAMRAEYGRCTSHVCIDTKVDEKWEVWPVGWVFVKRVPYTDTPKETYLQETWVTVFEEPPALPKPKMKKIA